MIWLILGKISAAILTIALVVNKDYSNEKEPFDKERKPFKWKRDWWPYRKDNVISKVIGGFLGALASSELAIPMINKYLDWPELAEGSIEIVGVIITTFGVAWLANKIFAA